MDGTDNQPTSPASPDAPSSGASRADGPLKFDFKLRFGSNDEADAQVSGSGSGELAQVPALDWNALTGVSSDQPKSYQTDGDLQSLIVQLANQIAGPDATGAPVISVTASATIENSRPATSGARAATLRHETPTGESEPAEVPGDASATVLDDTDRAVSGAPRVELRFAPVPPLPTSSPSVTSSSVTSPSITSDAPVPFPGGVAPAVLAGAPARRGAEEPVVAAAAAEAAQASVPVESEVEPVVVEPEVEPEVELEVEPEVVEPEVEPVAVEPELVVADPELVVADPELVVAEPELVVAEPDVVDPAVASVVAAVQADAAASTASAPRGTPVVPTLAPRASAPVAAPAPEQPATVAAPAPVAPAPAPAPAAAAPAAPVMLTGEASVQAAAQAAVTAASAPAPVAPALSLAKIERKPGAERPTKPVDFHALLGQAGLQAGTPVKRKRKRRPFRALFKLVVVLGIIGGGLYYGKTQILDKRWDAELKPVAEAVSRERELGWRQAVKVQVLPADEYAERLAISGLAVDSTSLGALASEWRAMGLAEGSLELEQLGTGPLADVPVFYDPTDGMIYEVEGLDDELREWALHRALAEALLDQHLGWGAIIADPETPRTEAVGLRMMIAGDARSVTQAVLDLDVDDVVDLDEQIKDLAEDVGAAEVPAPAYANALLGAGDGGAWVRFDLAEDLDARDELLEVRSDAGVLDPAREIDDRPDVIGASSESRGMLYWYHVLAGRLPAAEAWDAVIGWEGDEVMLDAETDDRLCVRAKVSAVDEPSRLRLLDALTRWATVAPVEATTTVASIGSEWITVTSCDPGTAADTVLNDAPPLHGDAPVEHVMLQQTNAETDEQRWCVIAAVRGFDVASVFAAGDQARIDQVVSDIGTACEKPT